MVRKLALAAALALVAACGGTEEITADPAFLEATPDVDSLLGEVTGDAATEGLAASSSALTSLDGLGQAQSAEMSEPAYLAQARFAVRGLNGIVRRAMTPVVELIKENPEMADGEVHVWGPRDRGNATYRFTMKKAAEKKYGWKLEGKAQGADDSQFQVVMAGGIALGDQAHRGKGVLGIDGDAFGAIDPALKSAGKLLMGFAHGPNGGKALAYGLKQFTPNTDEYQKVSALFRAIRGPAGGTIVRMATHSDISEPRNDSKELVLSRVRWLPGVGGRADGIVTLGDVAAGHYLIVNSCWNAQLQEGFQVVRDCEKGQGLGSCQETRRVGEPGNCAANAKLGEKLPDEDLEGGQSEAAEEGQEDVPPPAVMPDGSGAGL